MPASQLALSIGGISLLEWRPAAKVIRLRTVPTSPCVACPSRPTCKAPCQELEAAVGIPAEPDELTERPRADVQQIRQRRDEAFGDVEPPPDEPPPPPLPSWGELAEANRSALDRAVRQLPKKQRSVVRLLLGGMRQTDIARRRHVSDETISIMLRRARKRLAGLLGRMLTPPAGTAIHLPSARSCNQLHPPGKHPSLPG